MTTKKKHKKSHIVTMTLDEALHRKPKLRRGEKTAAELKAMNDDDIDYSDIPKLDETFWRNVQLLRPSPKEVITMRVDKDVLDWFRKQGKGYQSYINTVLRAFKESQPKGKR